jgi:hypothetical protein
MYSIRSVPRGAVGLAAPDATVASSSKQLLCACKNVTTDRVSCRRELRLFQAMITQSLHVSRAEVIAASREVRATGSPGSAGSRKAKRIELSFTALQHATVVSWRR